jgi:hypothetical protein
VKLLSTALFLLLAASSGFSQSSQNDDRAHMFPDRYSVSGFGARLVVTENPRDYVQKWQKPDIPKINSATEVKLEETVGVFVVFTGCQTNALAACNAEVDYTIYRPGGSVFADRKALTLWKGPASPDLRLAEGFLPFRLGKNEPSGQYKVKAKVSDLNAGISLELETKFRLK